MADDPVSGDDFDRLVARRLADVRERITAAGGRDVEVLAVTKSWGIEAVRAARRAGCTAVGENYAQEVVAKFSPDRDEGVGVHFIGQLQTNKVRHIVDVIDVYESVDRASLVAELAKRAPGAVVLIQVDATGEPGKGGCPVADVPALVATAIDAGLEVRGLMTVGPTVGGVDAARPVFAGVRALVDRLGLAACSMGMSDDLEVAVKTGSTQVRVGSALFGPRPTA